MKRLALSLVVLVAGTVFAQEIGTEISPTTPTSGAEVEAAPPPPPPQSKAGAKKGTKARAVKAEGWDGDKVSVSSGDFGIRAGFGASGSTGLPTGTGAARSVAAPTVGVSLMAGDAFKLLVDLGFGVAFVGSNAVFAMSTTVGFDYLFRTPGDVLRPLIHAGASLNLVGGNDVAVSAGVQFGFGAEYFFDPAFSINGRLMLAVPMGFTGDFALGIFTVTPGVGASWYF